MGRFSRSFVSGITKKREGRSRTQPKVPRVRCEAEGGSPKLNKVEGEARKLVYKINLQSHFDDKFHSWDSL